MSCSKISKRNTLTKKRLLSQNKIINMNTKFLYETVTSAINELRKMGFNKNFSLVPQLYYVGQNKIRN